MQDQDKRFMTEALKEAEAAFRENEVPIGAVIAVNGKIIARAHNLTERLHDVTAHAEMQAITAASEYLGGKYLTDCTIYVTVEPCPMCAAALGWAQIKRIVYAAPDPKRGYRRLYAIAPSQSTLPSQNSHSTQKPEKAPFPLHPKTKIEEGLLKEESETLMKTFFRQKRR